MTRTALDRSLAAVLCGAALLVLTARVSRGQGAPPVRSAAADTVPLLLPSPAAEPPSVHRPSSVPAARRTPTPPTILPPAPGGTPVDTTLRAPRQSLAPVNRGAGIAAGAQTPSAQRVAAGRALVRDGTDPGAAPAPAIQPAPPPMPAAQQSVAVRVVDSREARPNGATMRCKDGVYLFGTPSSQRCDANGGVTAMYETRRPPPTPPVRRP